MADDDNDLVSQVRIEGTEESTDKLKKYAEEGAASFDKVAAAAKKSADEIKAASDKTAGATNDAADAMKKLGDAKIPPTPAINVTAVSKAAARLGTDLRKTTIDLAKFIVKVTALTAGAAAAGAGILKLAQGIAKQSSVTTDAAQEQAKAQIAANNAQLTATTGAINYESAQRLLMAQFRNGTLDFAAYSTQLKELRSSYQEQIRVSAQVEAAQEAVRIENERLQKQAADRSAYNALVDTFGGPLLSSLINLGNSVQRVYNQFKSTLGPAIGSLLDIVTSTIDKNSSAINAFFTSTAAKINTFVSNNGPAIEKALTTIGVAASMVFDGMIAAAPTLLSLFNEVLVPGVTAVYNVIKSVTDAINSAFGTSLTPGFVLIAGLLLQLTGGFRLLFSGINLIISAGGLLNAVFAAFASQGLTIGSIILRLVSLFGPWGIALGIVAFALTKLAMSIDWTAFAANAQAAATGIVDWFSALPAQIGAFFDALWAHIVETATQLVTDFIAIWQAVVDWFAALPEQVGAIFVALGGMITDAINAAIESVKAKFAEMLATAKQYVQPVIDMFKLLISLIASAASGSSGSGDTPAFARGGHVGSGPVRGRGTSTSDSILALLSNSEFVIRAKAVAKYGRSFLEAVNSGRLDLGALPGFAMGGLVGGPTLSIAGAGDNASSKVMRPLTLQIGQDIFSGLMAPEAVADRLTRFAVNKQSKSAGARPTWHGGR
jgi:hypothetical protein